MEVAASADTDDAQVEVAVRAASATTATQVDPKPIVDGEERTVRF